MDNSDLTCVCHVPMNFSKKNHPSHCNNILRKIKSMTAEWPRDIMFKRLVDYIDEDGGGTEYCGLTPIDDVS